MGAGAACWESEGLAADWLRFAEIAVPTLACGAVGLGRGGGAAHFPWTEVGDRLSASPPHQVLISRASHKASVTRRK